MQLGKSNDGNGETRMKNRLPQIARALKRLVLGLVMMMLLTTVRPTMAGASSLDQDLDKLFNAFIKTNDPGVAVLVAQNGKILF